MPFEIKPFNQTKKQFAFNPEGLQIDERISYKGTPYYQRFIETIAFIPQRNGRIAAHLGTTYLGFPFNVEQNKDLTLDEILATCIANPQNFTSHANWDGSSMVYNRGLHWWRPETYEKAERTLVNILANYPELPTNYLGWYQPTGKNRAW